MELLFSIAITALGAILGSFIGVVAERVHTGQSWSHGRSKCNSCARHLTARDLVPVLSYLVSRGTCTSCGSRVPVTYLLLEATMAGLFLVSYLTIGLSFVLPVFLIALTTLAFIVVYDLRHTVVPVVASNLLMVLGLIAAVLTFGLTSELGVALIVAGAIGAGFYLLHVCSRGRAMGLGDTPVALGLSLLCAPYAYGGLLLSFWIGAVIGIIILVLQRGGPRMGIEVPFVPFLAVGYLVAYFFAWNPLHLVMW